MQRRLGSSIVILILALALTLGLGGAALAATPANDGAGRAFGQQHAEHAQQGMIGRDMNPGMHQGFSGWMGGS
jgi:hypothetical protein